MTQQQESEAEDYTGNSKDTWWRLFHLLIPDMVPKENRATFQLQNPFFPCKFHPTPIESDY